METSANICTACWQGYYYNGICNHCHHQKAARAERRPDALPLMRVVHGRYTIGEVLGKGGYGITYSAWDNKDRHRVALKELFPSTSVTRSPDGTTVVPNRGHETYVSELKEKFREEALRPQRLAEECKAVKVFDVFQSNNTVYYAMEYLEGCDLKVYQKQHGPLSWDFLAPIVWELLRTLEILHKENLIHRDISPDNIFLTKDGQVKLIDFGAARAYQGTLNFTVQKKASFAPWEQMESNGKQGPWTDIYALSITIYMLLSGKLPPKAQDRICGEAVIPLNTLCPNVPEHVVKAVEKGMNIRIKERYASAEEFMRALFPQTPVKQVSVKQMPANQPLPVKVEPLPMWWLRGIRGIYSGQQKQLAPNVVIRFGRTQSNDITFPETLPSVSRRQCEIVIDKTGRAFARDAGSSYGTFLNGLRLGLDWTMANPGDMISFGNEQFQLICRK